jgi:peptidoglycan/LPS O-acetylase OafA/YrhL
MNKRHFIALDSWRGIAALMVSILHFPTNSSISDTGIVQNSFVFVDFFFVLSGFIITANYREKLLNGFGFLRFAILRFGRLWPLHFVVLLFIICVEILSLTMGAHRNSVFSGDNSPEALISALFLVQSLGISPLAGNAPAWSISAEFWMYLLFAAILTCLPGIRNALIGFFLICSFLFLLFISELPESAQIWSFFARCILGFLIGVIVFDIFKNEKVRELILGKQKMYLLTLLELIAVGASIIFVSCMESPQEMANSSQVNVAAPFLFAFLVYVFAFDLGIISRMLQYRMFVFVGTISYSIYLTHMAFQQWIMGIAGLYIQDMTGVTFLEVRIGEDGAYLKTWGITFWQGDLATIVMIAMVILLAYASYRLIEEPSRNLVRRMVRGNTFQPVKKIAPYGEIRGNLLTEPTRPQRVVAATGS